MLAKLKRGIDLALSHHPLSFIVILFLLLTYIPPLVSSVHIDVLFALLGLLA